MSGAPSGWQNPKTNWNSADVPLPTDFNRIEGNIQAVSSALNTHKSSGDHDGRYYTKSQLNTSGGGGQVHWNNVTSKPSTFPAASHTHWVILSDTVLLEQLAEVSAGKNKVTVLTILVVTSGFYRFTFDLKHTGSTGNARVEVIGDGEKVIGATSTTSSSYVSTRIDLTTPAQSGSIYEVTFWDTYGTAYIRNLRVRGSHITTKGCIERI